MVLSGIFFALAAFFNAFMDMSFNMWHRSIMRAKGWDAKFWNLTESSRHAKRIFGTAVDGWHISKFIMLLMMQLSILTFTEQWYYIGLYPIIWGVAFETSKYLLTDKK